MSKVSKPNRKTPPKPHKTTPLTKRDKSAEYKKLPGSARQFQKVGGKKVISRRQFDELRKREGTPKQRTITPEKHAREGSKKFWMYAKGYRKTHPEMSGVSLRKIAHVKDFKQARKDLGTSSNAATGKKAAALVAFGLRPAGADYAVGDTPRAR